MKLLIVTQKVDKNDSNLGFFHEWLKEFSKHVETLSVICLGKGEYDLPNNVKVYSLGKEQGVSRVARLFNFYRYVFSLSGDYDAVLVHMNPVYLTLAGWYWKLSKKKVGLWYTHKSVDLKLRIAEKFTHHIFTASTESFRLRSKKIHITGHGIDTNLFSPASEQKLRSTFSLITVGRISPTKNLESIIMALHNFRERGVDANLSIIGATITREDATYEKKLKEIISKNGVTPNVLFLGAIPHTKLPRYYKDADVFINMSNTGSIDKSVLEAGSMDIPVITSNEAFRNIIEKRTFVEGQNNLSRVLYAIYEIKQKGKKISSIREYVIKQHSLTNLIPRIISFYE